MKDDLIKAGFKVYPAPELTAATNLYQKRIRDKNGTRYFINVYEFNNPAVQSPSWELDLSFEGTGVWGGTCWIKFSVNDATPPDVERIAGEIWSRLQPNYYERDQ